MFNLYAQRGRPDADAYKQERIVFQSQPFPQRLAADAKALAQTMALHGMADPHDALAQQGYVEYWSYVKEFHPKYLAKVMQQAEVMAKQLSSDFQNHPENFPLPAKDQGGGAGGMGGGDAGGAPPPATAANENRMVLGCLKAFVLPDGTVVVKKAKPDGRETPLESGKE